mmetsp:Transcript_33882/g.39112  ORF Transcript_33882/g.39112 Transcript_33882/m.39112 type:complete len:82 (+) Transcript_33882:723-968(+)
MSPEKASCGRFGGIMSSCIGKRFLLKRSRRQTPESCTLLSKNFENNTFSQKKRVDYLSVLVLALIDPKAYENLARKTQEIP